MIDPDAPPPALPQAGVHDSPGALRIPQDVTGTLPEAGKAVAPAAQTPQAKMITVTPEHIKEPSTAPAEGGQAAGAQAGGAPAPQPTVKIYRGTGSPPG